MVRKGVSELNFVSCFRATLSIDCELPRDFVFVVIKLYCLDPCPESNELINLFLGSDSL
jgi:hypothetical protein